jgi:P27 family predicted phage terminase small subunit
MPNERARRLGNPSRKNLPDAAAVAKLQPLDMPTPDHLGPEGAGLWVAVTTAASAWLAPSDALTLIMLCELYDRRAEYKKCLTDYGALIVQPKDGSMVANPAAGLLAQTEKQITQIAASLGLTPSDRSRLGLAEVKAAATLANLLPKRPER